MEPRYGMFVKRQKSGHCDNLFQDLPERTLEKEPSWALNRISILAHLVCLCGFGITWKYSLEETQRDLKIQPPLVGFPLAGTESKYRVKKKNKTPQNNQTKKPLPTKIHPNPSLTIGLYQGVEPLRVFKANTCSCPNFLRHQNNELSKPTLQAMEKRLRKPNVGEKWAHLVNATLVWIALLGQVGQSAQLEPGCCKPIFTSQSTEGLC